MRRRFGNGNSVDIGLRVLDLDYKDDDRPLPLNLDVGFQGLSVG